MAEIAKQRAHSFVRLWVFSHLFHYELYWIFGARGGLKYQLFFFTLVGLLTWLFLQPGRPLALALVAGFQLLDWFWFLPLNTNHWNLVALINIGLLGAIVLARLRTGGPSSNEQVLDLARPALLRTLGLFYFFTGFWKLNRSYLEPETSCVAWAWGNLQTLFSVPDLGALALPLAVVVMGLEIVLGLWLIFRPRGLPQPLLWAAVLLHVCLGLEVVRQYLNFSMVMFPLLFLAGSGVGQTRVWLRPPRRWILLAGFALLLFAGITAWPKHHYYWLRWGLFVAALALVLPLYRRERPWPLVVWGPKSLLVVPLLALVIGLGPWLGLRNRVAWQMYSNLRLEPSASNHFLMRRSLDLWGFMADEVEVISFSDEGLDRYFKEAGRRWPRVELQRRLEKRRGDGLRMTVRWQDQLLESQPLDQVLDRWGPLASWQRLVPAFRPLGPEVARRCQW